MGGGKLPRNLRHRGRAGGAWGAPLWSSRRYDFWSLLFRMERGGGWG